MPAEILKDHVEKTVTVGATEKGPKFILYPNGIACAARVVKAEITVLPAPSFKVIDTPVPPVDVIKMLPPTIV